MSRQQHSQAHPPVVFSPWIKVPYTLFVAILVPAYWDYYGFAHFLWFSDIALLAVAVVLWRPQRLLASMMALAVLAPEIVWNVGFFGRLLFDVDLVGIADYMFDETRGLFIRGLSLFHVVLPPLLLWAVYRLGYDRRALLAQTLLAWAVLPLSRLFATPDDNINWALGFEADPPVPGGVWLVLLMLAIPTVIYLPTHAILRRWFARNGVQA